MNGSIVEFENVSVVVDGRAIIDELSWQVTAGQKWVVLGANGAGKTTLLKLLTGLVAPTSGSVTVLGEDVTVLDDADLVELRTRVGWCGGAVADVLPHDRTVADLVLSACYATVDPDGCYFGTQDVARARELLTSLGGRGLADRLYGTLSDGERKRVQIARALMTDPELLLLDEPSAGLDLAAREALLRRLGRIAAEPAGPAMITVTHYLEEVPAGFTHALLLREGRQVAAGPIVEALTAPYVSACYGMPLVIDVREQRYAARALI